MVRVHPCEACLGLCDWRREKALIMAEINAPDPVNPAHYQGDYVMRIIEDFKLGFCLGNVAKYVLRAENKGKLVDLKKAAWYLDREIKALEAHAAPK